MERQGRTPHGVVRGFRREPTDAAGVASAAFVGIPFSEQAVGELRFIPKSFVLGKAGLGKATRKAHFAANPDAAKRDIVGAVGRHLTDAPRGTAVLKATGAGGAGAAVATESGASASAPGWAYSFSWPSPVFTYAIRCPDVPLLFDCLDSADLCSRRLRRRAPAAARRRPPTIPL